METRFAVGQKVRLATPKALQGLDPKRVYVVAEKAEWITPFGTYVTYYLKGDVEGAMIAVANGHLILEEAGQ